MVSVFKYYNVSMFLNVPNTPNLNLLTLYMYGEGNKKPTIK